MPKGILTQKMLRQPNVEIRSPPRLGPEIRPALTTMAKVPSAPPRSFEGKVCVMIAGPLAMSMAAPIA